MTKPAASLDARLAAQSTLRPHVRRGLQALKAEDRQLIAEDQRSYVWDSIDLDAATSVLFPNEHRWDYIVSVPHKSELVGIEPHSATDGEIRVVTAKKRQAADFLRDHLLPHHRISKWLWVSHGKVGFSKMERARRILDQNGITFAGRLIREF